jgi:hypothetical protein
MNGAKSASLLEPAPVGRLLHLGWAILALLVLENLLGIFLNLYVALPTAPTFLQVFVSIPLLTTHIATAFLLFALAVYGVLLARRLHVPGIVRMEVLEVVFLVLAIQEGFTFTFTQNNAFSLGMEVGFLGAVVAQVVVLFRLARGTHPGASAATVSPRPDSLKPA